MKHSPVASLANRTPVEGFTGLPCPPPAYVLYLPGQEPREVSISNASIKHVLAQLRLSIEGMHRAVTGKRESPGTLKRLISLWLITRCDHVSMSDVKINYCEDVPLDFLGTPAAAQPGQHENTDSDKR
ncbi:Hypothetical protein PHPALM_21046 [Phytophthora palmivora]|uniref:Uncharacterized protein n=1 Tax=Phytophthora palmivora TaxID=4796 RepID=A0A2P4XDC8_9STRA|nr:Hypothetical protein PHPALM_21046 [Phytophthora palmivora]